MGKPANPKRKPKDFARINAVKMGPQGGRTRAHACKRCKTVHRFKECPFCGQR